MISHEHLKSIMKARGLRQVDLANLIGVGKSYMSVLMNNDRVVTTDTLAKLCEALDCSADALLKRY